MLQVAHDSVSSMNALGLHAALQYLIRYKRKLLAIRLKRVNFVWAQTGTWSRVRCTTKFAILLVCKLVRYKWSCLYTQLCGTKTRKSTLALVVDY